MFHFLKKNFDENESQFFFWEKQVNKNFFLEKIFRYSFPC
jgi:hypothetical protein